MSQGIENLLERLIGAIEANTAAHGGKSSSSAGSSNGGKGAGGKSNTSSKKGVTVEQAQAAVTKIKNDFSLDEARKVLKKFDIAKLGDLTEDDAEKVYKAAVAHHEKLQAAAADGEEEEEDGI